MIELNAENKTILLEALEDMMYKLSLQLDEMKGRPLDKQRKELTSKQSKVEKLQHQISLA
ncbi:hypothetical protein [Ekhidna sp.]|uniref:hypothetical protein n=1 Tax=Ekhidna sp. TaxID=2608089 RepID=UPI003B5058EF